MSGHKRTTVSLNDLDLQRLIAVEERLRNVEEDYGHIRERIKKTQEKELSSFRNEIVQTQSEILNSLNDEFLHFQKIITTDLDAIQITFDQNLIDQSQWVNDNLNEIGLEIWDRAVGLINENAQELTNILDQKYQEIMSVLLEIQKEFNAKKNDQEGVAHQSLIFAQESLQHLIGNYPIEKYYPGELENLYNLMHQAEINFQNGFLEACLVSTQNIIFELERMKREIIQNEWQRKSLLSIAKRKISQLREVCLLQNHVNAIGLNGEDLGIQIDVEYWSEGKYQAVLDRINRLLVMLERQSELLNSEDLSNIFNTDFVEIQDDIQKAIYISRKNVLASQIRFNIACCVIKALEEQGFMISEGNYEGNDQRSAYKVLLHHYDGSEVAVSISEIPGEVGISQLDLESYDAELRTEHELRQRAREVAESLSVYGLFVGKIPGTKSNKLLAEGSYLVPDKPKTRISEGQVQYGRN